MTTSYTCARAALAIAERAMLARTVKHYSDAASEIFELSCQCDIPELVLLASIMQRRAERLAKQPRDAVRAAIARRMA